MLPKSNLSGEDGRPRWFSRRHQFAVIVVGSTDVRRFAENLTIPIGARLHVCGFAVFMVATVGYVMALGFLLTVLLKPLLPNRIGLWVGHGDFVFGTTDSPSAGVHEVLGSLYIPVTMLLAFGAAIGTTHALRWLIRTRHRPAH
jgi:hypothetical protein